MSSDLRLLWESAGLSVPEHWEFKTINDLLEHPKAISVGVMYPGSHVEDGVPLIKVSDVKNGAIAHKPDFCIADTVDDEYKRTRLNGTEFLITLVGNPGDCVVVNHDMAGWNAARALAVVRLKDIELREWLRYVLLSKPAKHLIESRLNTTVQKTLNLKDIRELGVPLPPDHERGLITGVVNSIEDKMLLNRQTNQTLEHIAQALFKSWFVDFEPTRAKIAAKQARQDPERAAMAAISGKTVAELEQLDAAQLAQLKTTAALFPDGLVESELGEVPEGWEVKNIDQIATRVAMGPFGSNIKTDTFVSEGVPMINGQQLRGIMLEDGDNKFITPAHADKLIKCNAYRWDIVITHRGTLGQVSIIPENSQYERYIVSQSQCYIRPDKEQISSLFLVYYLNSYIGQHELMAYKSQVGVPSIAKPVTNIRKIQLVVPRKNVLDCFHSIVSVLHRQISERVNEINTLSATRDTLLPKLLSGELSPTQAEVA